MVDSTRSARADDGPGRRLIGTRTLVNTTSIDFKCVHRQASARNRPRTHGFVQSTI
jgi:hypothetical protein